MAEITAASVNSLRKRTGLPLMDCKKALSNANGDEEGAVRWLRENGIQIQSNRGDRETAFGRFGIFAGTKQPAGGIVEFKCESDPVAKTEEFIQLANDLAKQLALGPGAATPDELLTQPSPSKKGMTLGEVKDEMFNRIREVFRIGRMQRFDGACGAYSHNSGTISGVLLSVTGGNDEAAKDVCMHVAAMRPGALRKEDIAAEDVERERGILREAALREGKPVNIVDKMVEGRLRNFYAERALMEQPFVKDDKLTVGKFAEQHQMGINKFVHWELGKE